MSFFVLRFWPFLLCNYLFQTLTQQEHNILKQMKKDNSLRTLIMCYLGQLGKKEEKIIIRLHDSAPQVLSDENMTLMPPPHLLVIILWARPF